MRHLTADERRRLETLLNRGESFRSIAEVLGDSSGQIIASGKTKNETI